MSYERTGRYLAPRCLSVEVDPGVGGDEVRLLIDRAYLDASEVQDVTPEPRSVEADGDRVAYAFSRFGSATPLAVTFDLRPLHRGVVDGRIGVAGRPPVEFRQLVYP